MLVLYFHEDCELASRTKVDFELTNAVYNVVVDAFAIAAGREILTRLPIALEDVARVARQRHELRAGWSSGQQKHHREDSAYQPGSPGERRPHVAPLMSSSAGRSQDSIDPAAT